MPLFKITLILTLLTSQFALSQPEIDLLRMYDVGGSDGDLFSDIYYTADGNHLVSGQSDFDPWVLELDQEGNIVWEYSESGVRLFSVIEADNGDAVSVGIIGAIGMFGAVRVDSEGELVWRREYFRGRATAVIELKNGSFLICGYHQGIAYVVMIEPNGEVIWNRSFADVNVEYRLDSMRETEDGVVLAGWTESNRTTQGWVVKIDPEEEGEVFWTQDYDIDDRQTDLRFNSIVSTEFGFAVGGLHQRDGGGFALYFIDDDGESMERFLYDNGTWFECLEKLGDGGFILVGYKNAGRQYPLALRTDSQGNIRWTKDLSNLINEQPEPQQGVYIHNQLRSVIVQPNDVIVACGWMYNGDERHGDGLILRLEPDQLSPMITHWLPRDTLFSVLQGDTTEFVVRARDQQGNELGYEWFFGDSSLGGDTTVTIIWDELGEYSVQCRVSNDEFTTPVDWRVTVTDLYIDSHTPDSLDVAIRRNTTVDFSVTTRAIEGDPVQYEWVYDGEVLDEFDDSLSILFEQGRNHEVEVVAYRRDQNDNVIWQLTMFDLIVNFWPRELDIAVNIDTVMEFSIDPFNPEDPSLDILWTVDDDSVDNRSWTFINFDSVGEHQVFVHISDSSSADSMSWNVRVNPNAVTEHDLALLPSVPTLYPPSPNPFNSQTSVRYALPVAGQVRLKLFDVSGRLVSELVDQRQSAGWYDVVVDGSGLVSGVYFVRMVTEKEFYTQKLLLLK